jgi:hypothetical protein
MQTMAMLEAIGNYGRVLDWLVLAIEGVEIIPAGRVDWLDFVWLSHRNDQ